jgi:hypothetical protein
MEKGQLYRWWLYRGPGFRRVRRALRKTDSVLPPGFEVRDSVFTGGMALEAATEVDRLRTLIPPHFVRDIAGERLQVTVCNPVNTSLDQGSLG